MLEHLEFAAMTVDDLIILQAWFADEELKRRMAGLLPLGQYYTYLQSNPASHAWMVRENGTPVGAVILEGMPDAPHTFAFFVNPTLRSRGYGRQMLRQLLLQAKAIGVKKLTAGVESNNIASQRCLESVGFSAENEVADGDGFWGYCYRFK